VADSALPMLLFLGFLFVSLTLILGLGLVNREEEREREEREANAGAAPAPTGVGSGFLLTADTAAARQVRLADRLAPHAETERDGGPLDAPDREAQGDRRGPLATVDGLVAQLEEFLRDEAAAVAAFASAPSLGGLFGESALGFTGPHGAEEGNGRGERP